jgi:hypothetical protein
MRMKEKKEKNEQRFWCLYEEACPIYFPEVETNEETLESNKPETGVSEAKNPEAESFKGYIAERNGRTIYITGRHFGVREAISYILEDMRESPFIVSNKYALKIIQSIGDYAGKTSKKA